MPFAANGHISRAPIQGGIEITDEEYAEALTGMTEGKEVRIEAGGLVVDFPPVAEPAPEPEPAPDPNAPYKLFKSAFIRRLTSEEAGVLEAVLAGADAKLRLLFNSVEYFMSDDPLFAELQGAVGAALSPSRAHELLAAES